MNHAKLIEKIQALPVEQQAEVFDFVDFLASRIKGAAHNSLTYDEWTNAEFGEMAMNQALRGMEDEPSLYTFDDLKERWQ
jgi:hypothetical protein